MTFAEMVKAVQLEFQGWAALSGRFAPDDIVTQLNIAQRDVARDLLTLDVRQLPGGGLCPLLIRAKDSPPAMVAAGGVEPILPSDAHSAIVALTCFRLAGKFGDQPGAPKLRDSLWGIYGSQLQAARRSMMITNISPPDSVTDEFDPERADIMEF